MKRAAFSVSVLAPLALAFAFTACGSKSDSASADPKGKGSRSGAHGLEYSVQTAPLVKRKVRYSVSAPGSIEAFQQVQVTARVAGALDKVLFAEGENVTAGQVLAAIESDRYEVAVGQAKAAVDKANASELSAEADLKRRNGAAAAHPGLIPQEEIEQHATAVLTAKADVDAAKQAQRVAELNLRDSYVKAPIQGTVQTRTVQQGQYLQPGAVLATILQLDPMILRFQVSEQDAPRLKTSMKASMKLKESANEYTATITLVGGNADPTTRLVPITAQVDKTDKKYWLRPGAFCEVTVAIGDAREAIVVPSMAVSPTERGNMVYVVDDKNIAHQRIVELGMHTADGGIEITRGLNVGETLIVRGVEPLSDGAPVKVTETTTLEAAAGTGDAGAPSSAASAASGASTTTGATDTSSAAPDTSAHPHHGAQ